VKVEVVDCDSNASHKCVDNEAEPEITYVKHRETGERTKFAPKQYFLTG
jgi:hypothetical protein